MHGEAAQAQAKQQTRHGHIPRHLATHAHPFALRLALRDGVGEKVQHRGMHRVVKVRDSLVGTVNRQRVLDQVVGADGEKVEVFEEQRNGERGGGHFDHGAQLDRALSNASGFQLLARAIDQGQRLTDLAGVCEHGNEQVHRPVRGGSQYGAQLRQEHRRVGQTPADRAQAQGRIEVVFAGALGHTVQRFVSAHVHRADGHRQALHALDRALVGLVLLFLVGQFAVATHEEEFAAEQPHTHGTGLERAHRVFGLFDVGQQLDLLPVKRDSGRVLQT